MHDILLPSHRRTRLVNSFLLPDQAALAARLPVLRRRVPMRAYWAHQPIALRSAFASTWRSRPALTTEVIVPDPRAVARLVRDSMSRVEPRHAPVTIVRATHHERLAFMRSRWFAAIAAATGAALIMYLADPSAGRRRRALSRDKLARTRTVFTREMPHRLERRGRFFRGVARGVAHGTRSAVGHNGHDAHVDDETLVDRVRSEVLRDARFHSGEINIDAYEGTVTLRGQMTSESDIRRLVQATRHIDGVAHVRSYLHLPDQLPPNKAVPYAHAERHLPSM